LILRGFCFCHQEQNPDLRFYKSIVAFMADIAKMEGERLSERTKLGLRRTVSQGKKLGRPKGSKDSTKRKRKRTGYLLGYSE
jgi:DNA invertase Pin-like site-specific DNA recombinase